MSDLDTRRIPCSVITGFLGAGKTTLIRHLLENAGGRRLAVIVNEFGDVGIDGDILRTPGSGSGAGADGGAGAGCGIPACQDRETDGSIVELANGCLCCTVADDFVPALDRLLALSPPVDHILIETSGLALPKPLVQAFNWPTVRSRVTVDAVLAVVDGLALAEGRVATDLEALEAQRRGDSTIDHDSPVDEVFVDQMACADMVLLTKTDLLDASARQAAQDRIRPHLGGAVRIVPVSGGVVDPGVLLGLERAVEDDIEGRVTLHDGMLDHEHDDFESLVVTLDPVVDTDDLARRVETLFHEAGALRVKGHVEVAGKPMRYRVQSVGPRVASHYDRLWKEGEPRVSRLVVIGERGLDRARIGSILGAS
ncbi:cobalamin biosynthesis protein CobW [Phaeovibrio sulfidiphilus]|uniref:Cobalamin biosynthesis protein CobW n=1 Tax=Phaeovibrio sulfidiphilus TaxID=1220600 RepID=A0A8J6YW24_9PROT|nr:cobalamin biosynthesis protein CobW [Phaeovibrio sulfidiphilus]MBE1236762.1 cobalamin biosynthesis protein CobW [Phaeovibrio sulfidiphilus]